MSEPQPTVLLSEQEVAARVAAVAEEIAPRIDDETVMVCLLTGGIWFAADLTRALARLGRLTKFDALWLSSYRDERQSYGRCEVRADLQRPVLGRKALIVDDVFDTGLSLSEAARLVKDAGASEVLTAVFASKPWPTERAIQPDFVAWEAPPRFLVGYGMDVAGGMRDVAGLVVEEKIGLELAQEIPLGQTAEEHRLVNLDVPVHQSANRALMRRRAARRDQRGADAHRRGTLLLQTMQSRQKRLEWPLGQRLRRIVALVGLKGVKSMGLIDPLGLIGEQHRVTVKGDADLMRVGIGGSRRVRVDLRRRHTGLECRAHVRQMRGEKQVGMKRPQIAPRRLTAGEAAALDRQTIMLRRTKHAHARDRVVARQDHHLDPLSVVGVERQQLAHQRKSDARLGRDV
jgi:hypoxanthine phosphoribosyltransferase